MATTTTARSRFQRIALFGIVGLLAAFAVQQLGGVSFATPDGQQSVAIDDDVLLDETLPAVSGGTLRLDLSSENVRVEVGSPGAARITITGESEEARQFFERQRYVIEADGDAVVLRANPLRRNGRQQTLRNPLDVVVTVPALFSIEHDGGSGDLVVGDLGGERITIDIGSGDATLGAMTHGEITIDSGSGDVFVQSVEGATLSIETGSGDVLVERSSGTAEVDTGSGDVCFDRHAGAFDANTGSGDVTATLVALDLTSIDTGSGDVALTMLGGADLEIESNGDLTMDDALGFAGQREDSNASGTLGGGGPDVTIDTGSGDISLRAGTPESTKQ